MTGISERVTDIECPNCKGKDEHTVVYSDGSIYHLRCLHCMAMHVSRVDDNTKTKSRSRLRNSVALSFEELMEQFGAQKGKPYRITRFFSEGEFIEHSKFGKGYVLAVFSPPTKMEVLFADQRRVLACAGRTSSADNKKANKKRVRELS